MDIIFATKNKGKILEINRILEGSEFNVISMEEAFLDFDIVEDGSTFEENAIIKAVAVANASGKFAMSDDSGLEIDFLDKAPGVLSARFLGEDTAYNIKNGKILEMLENVEESKRAARFVSVIAFAYPQSYNKAPITTRGEVEGIIAQKSSGDFGFGYDPIFYLKAFGKTMAELDMDTKNSISHRGKALLEMKENLLKMFK